MYNKYLFITMHIKQLDIAHEISGSTKMSMLKFEHSINLSFFNCSLFLSHSPVEHESIC